MSKKSKNRKKKNAESAIAKSGRAANKNTPAALFESKKAKILLIAAVLLLILAAAAVTIVLLNKEGGTPPEEKSVLTTENLTECFAKLKGEGKIATYYTYSSSDIDFKEKELEAAGVDAVIERGCFAKQGVSDEIMAYEFKTEGDAERFHTYYEEVLFENYRAIRVGKTVVYGTNVMLDMVLPYFEF